MLELVPRELSASFLKLKISNEVSKITIIILPIGKSIQSSQGQEDSH